MSMSNAGQYRGVIQDAGVSQTRKAKLPQLVATLLATSRYNDVTEEWDDWSEYGEIITGYFVLVTQDEHGNVRKCLSYDQVIEAVGWDGETYSGLAAMDLKGVEVQFRVAEEMYNNQPQMKVNWIAAVDAEMGLRKLSGQDLTSLDAQFGLPVTRQPATAVKPMAAKKGKGKGKAAPKPPKAPPVAKAPPVVPEIPEDIPIESCTDLDAYQACVDANAALDNPVPKDVLDTYWSDRADEIARDTQKVTGEEWAQIRDAVIENLSIPF